MNTHLVIPGTEKVSFLPEELDRFLVYRSSWLCFTGDRIVQLAQELNLPDYNIWCFHLELKKPVTALLKTRSRVSGLYFQWKNSIDMRPATGKYQWCRLLPESPKALSLEPGIYDLLILGYPPSMEERVTRLSPEIEVAQLQEESTLLPFLPVYRNIGKLSKAILGYQGSPLPARLRNRDPSSEIVLRFEEEELFIRNRYIEERMLLLHHRYMDETERRLNLRDDLRRQVSNLDGLEQYIKDNLELPPGDKAEGPLTLHNLARFYHMTKSAFHEALAARYQERLDRLIHRLRLERVMELLLEGKNSISEIAILTGFTEPSNLSRAIHKRYGHSPGYFQRASSPASR
jgi:AraC-like DNA-binding protein